MATVPDHCRSWLLLLLLVLSVSTVRTQPTDGSELCSTNALAPYFVVPLAPDAVATGADCPHSLFVLLSSNDRRFAGYLCATPLYFSFTLATPSAVRIDAYIAEPGTVATFVSFDLGNLPPGGHFFALPSDRVPGANESRPFNATVRTLCMGRCSERARCSPLVPAASLCAGNDSARLRRCRQYVSSIPFAS